MTLYGHALWTAVEWCRADGQDYRFCQVQCREPKTGQQKVQLYYEDDPLWPSRYMIYLCLGIQNDKAVSFKRYSDVAYQLATTAWKTRRRKKNLHALFWKRRPDAKGMRTQKLQKWKLTHLKTSIEILIKNPSWDDNEIRPFSRSQTSMFGLRTWAPKTQNVRGENSKYCTTSKMFINHAWRKLFTEIGGDKV